MEQDVQQVLEETLAKGQDILIEGKVISYIPELARADSSNLGCCTTNADGSMHKAGDYNIPFTMQSIVRTFSLILTLQTSGYDHTSSRVGMEPTGDRLDDILQLELKDQRPFNPMINAGTVVATDYIATADPFGEFLTLIKKPYGNPRVRSNERVYHSEKRTGTRNRSITYPLENDHVLGGEPEGMLDVYLRMCSIMCTTKDLVRCAMILSNKSMDPKTRECLLDTDAVCIVTMLMMLYGMYNGSGGYAVRVNLPSESNVGGDAVAVGQSGMGTDTFGSMLNKRGDSMGGERILQYLLERLGYHTFT